MYKTKPAFVDRQSNCTDFVQILIVDVFLKKSYLHRETDVQVLGSWVFKRRSWFVVEKFHKLIFMRYGIESK